MYKKWVSKMIQNVVTGSGTLSNKIQWLKKSNSKALKEKSVQESAITILERSRLGDVLTRRSDPDLIINVRYSKMKYKRMLSIYITRLGD